MSRFWPTNPDRENHLRLTPVPRPVWDRFLAGCGSSFPYHTWAWLDFVCKEYRLDWHPLGIWEGEALVGLFPVMSRRLGPFRLAGSPLMKVIASTPFLGPMTAPERFRDILLALENFLRQHHFAHFEISFPYPLSETAFEWVQRQGYTIETCEAVFLNLKDHTVQQLWEGLSGSCRRAIRKAQANGVEIMIPHENSFLETYEAMCQDVYRDSGRLPHLSASFYQNLWTTFAGSVSISCLLAIYQKQIIAGAIFVLNPPFASYLSGASFNQWQSLRPNNLLQWHFIEWAALQGYEVYDLGGVAHAGITRFKLSFGGHISSYTRLHRANTKLAHFGRQIYQSTIPLWRRFQSRISNL